MGATREEIKGINDTINNLIENAKDKQEDMSEKLGPGKYLSETEMITQLKKVEIKFHELADLRKVFNFFDPNSLRTNELEIKARNKARITEAIKEKLAREKAK